MGRSVVRLVVCGLVVAVTLFSTAGIVAGHGTFAAVLATQGPAVQDAPEPFRLNVTTGGADELPDDVPTDGPVRANYTVRVDGQVVESDSFELGFLDWRVVTFEHTFAETGTHQVSMNATFSTAGGEWRADRRTSFPMRVVEPGTGAALRACSDAAGGDALGQFQCHLAHRGPVSGFLSGLFAVPAAAVLLVAAIAVGLLGVWVLRDRELF